MIELAPYKGYKADIGFSFEDGEIYGKIAGIKDLVSFGGANEGALEQAFHEAVEDYIVTCNDLHKTPER